MAIFRRIFPALLALSVFCSCEWDGLDLNLSVDHFGEETRKVMILYEAGFNSLGSDIAGNIRTLQEGYLPGNARNDDVLLVMSHVTKVRRTYSEETAPALIRMYSNAGEPVMDTLQTWPVGTSLANAAMVNEVLNLVKERFPAAGYGAVFSSHATGWLPVGYFSDPKPFENGDDRSPGGNVWNAPRFRSFGQEYYESGSKKEEIELHEFAAAIPYHLDYILFDACLMASVEVAWALKDVCSYLAVSPCEIPAAGFDYSSLAEHLLHQETPDLKSVCEAYYARYEDDTVYGATISMIDCSALEELADACRPLFDRYREGILNLDGKNVQVYDRILSGKNYYIFFDLKDLLREAGATESDLATLQEALDQALVYEAHTDRFIDIRLNRCCGLSMYLPAYPGYKRDRWHGTEALDSFYKKNVAWNQATSLVE